MTGSSDGVAQDPLEQLYEQEDIEKVLLLNPGSIDRAIEDDEPMYFPHDDREVVFSVHAVPEDEVELDDGWEFWHPDTPLGLLSRSSDYFVCADCTDVADTADDEMPVFPQEDADIEFECLHCEATVNPAKEVEA